MRVCDEEWVVRTRGSSQIPASICIRIDGTDGCMENTVSATPMTSRPESANGSACDWMGVGVVNDLLCNTCRRWGCRLNERHLGKSAAVHQANERDIRLHDEKRE